MSPATLVTLTLMIAHVHCSEWERMYDGTWRAEGRATIYLEDGGTLTVDGVDVAKGTDLQNTLEAFCRTDLDGGLGDPPGTTATGKAAANYDAMPLFACRQPRRTKALLISAARTRSEGIAGLL